MQKAILPWDLLVRILFKGKMFNFEPDLDNRRRGGQRCLFRFLDKLAARPPNSVDFNIAMVYNVLLSIRKFLQSSLNLKFK